jgi:Ni,Fe-hydrogenase I cytochrome b subunit
MQLLSRKVMSQRHIHYDLKVCILRAKGMYSTIQRYVFYEPKACVLREHNFIKLIAFFYILSIVYLRITNDLK